LLSQRKSHKIKKILVKPSEPFAFPVQHDLVTKQSEKKTNIKEAFLYELASTMDLPYGVIGRDTPVHNRARHSSHEEE
jgi:hypothetical protein